MTTANVSERINSLSTKTKIALACGAAFVVSPIIFTVVKGAVGLAAAGVVGLAIVNLAPVISMKFANWKLRAIIKEAQENPIETMHNLILAKKEAFKQFREHVTVAVTARDNFKTKVADFTKKYPARAAEFQTQLDNMTMLVERKKTALEDARNQIALGEDKLTEMQAYWDMSLAAQAANKAAGMDTGDLYEKLKADTAVDAVYASMNRAFAELEVAAALDVDAPASIAKSAPQAALPNNPGEVIEGLATVTPIKTKVR